ncbi:MAG TPA: OmpA family protein [Nitrospira sp.]|nr:OmpA family protein [Nitrospira sp.]
MKITISLLLVLYSGMSLCLDWALAQASNLESVRILDGALAFSSGMIEKTSPMDGTVNLVTGDNQASGNRMLLGKGDSLYLKLDNPADVVTGDLFTVYRRVRKVFHPVTREYLGFVVNRSAVVRVTATDHALTTAEILVNYGPVAPGDPVTRFKDPAKDVTTASAMPAHDATNSSATNASDLEGMIVELQADRAMTLVSQSNVVYIDRGREDGLKTSDLLEIHRYSAGLPPRKIGQLKVLSTEPRTAVAKVLRANTRVIKGDRFRFVGTPDPSSSPVVALAHVPTEQTNPTPHAPPVDLVSSKMKVQDAAGQSRLNLGEFAKFLHYESGDAALKPENYTLLDQLIEYLRMSGDTRLIRIEGHTDNVEIGPSLKARYPSNWELSKVRANGVLRYLIEKGGIDSSRITAMPLGDSKPTASNEMEEGRTKNRRVEIVLYIAEADAPEEPSQTRTLSTDSPHLTANGSNNLPSPSTPASDTGGSATRGTLSLGDSSQSSTGTPDASSPSVTMEPNRPETAQQQPVSGTPTE